MTDNHSTQPEPADPNREEMMSALFANLVIQQTNMALMFLGRVPHPETGERKQDFEAARLFIDQLDMIECKTKGNLDKHEEQLLKQSLTTLRMAFVEAVEAPPSQSAAAEKPPGTTAAPSPSSTAADSPASSEEESRKKFSKKY